MEKVRSQVGQGHEHKATEMQARMGNLQPILPEDEIAIQKQVHIKRAWATGLQAHSPHPALHPEGNLHDLLRGQPGLDFSHKVEKKRLILQANRLRLVDRGDSYRRNTLI